MAAGLTESRWSIGDLVRIRDERTPKPAPRGPYRKLNSN